MSCPIQPPARLFCSTAMGSGAAGAGGGCADLLDIGMPQPLLANPHPLFPTTMATAATKQTLTTNGIEFGTCQPQQQHPQQQTMTTTTPGAWFFQQSPTIDGTDASSVLGLASDTNSSGAAALSSAVSSMPPIALSPPPGSLAHQQLLARFGPRHNTESVEVPSSEHVAEIVGRQGCKIKALRAKTNTYIKTPVRGEEPVFVVTGRHEDVLEAKREIECAAEHFTQIRASRRHSQGGCPAPGHVTAYVRVPLRVVGLVVGPKGNTIKRIQQDTHTYIITPSREREPIFEVTGLPQNVEAARREIEQHIYQRTGNMPITDSSASIANFDLHTAALQAQHAALHANATNRPNYGALAVTSTTTARQFQQQQSQHHHHQQAVLMPAMAAAAAAAAQQQQHHQQFQQPASNACHQQMQQQQQTQYQQQSQQQHNANLGLSLGDLNGCFRSNQPQQQQSQFLHHNDFVPSSHDMMIGGGTIGTKLYSSAAASPPPSFGPIGGTAGAVAPPTTTSTATTALSALGTSVSSNNLHAMLGALELDNGGTPPQQQQQQGHFSSAISTDFKLGGGSSSLLLLRSTSNGYGAGAGGAVIQQQNAANTTAPSAFSPWRMPSSAVDAMSQNDFLDILSSTSPSPLFSASGGNGGGSAGNGSVAGGCHSSSYSVGSCAIGGFVSGGGGLSSVNSTSRDEGLGDSPTNSFGRPNGPDPYQHLMTIWADVCDPSSTGLPMNGGGDECGKSASSDQQQAEAAKDKSGCGGELKSIG
ncbi:hypothetical protein niasHS_018211 [Heterodera schachtii]|uniref:K Homology domain-containing protein n=1 Tax=Heterodera schachtii TaxID=97005 RepID=A0ABD2HS18_HETSC